MPVDGRGGFMAWRLEGDYIASCSCNLICPCPVDGRPNDPAGKGECRGVAVFSVDAGNLNEVDLAGTRFALVNHNPSNISAGNWKLGVVVDGASDEQYDAIGRILGGQEGGPFADFSALVGESLGVERGDLSYGMDGGSVDGSRFSYEQLKAQDGSDVQITGGPFAFSNPYKIGKTSGSINVLGVSFESSYGESGHFTYTDQSTEHVRG
jgi:hypothetical protein